MSPAVRGALALGVVVVGLPATVTALGARLPEQTRFAVTVHLEAPIEIVWRVVTAFEDAPAWRPDVAAIHLDRTADGSPLIVAVDPAGRRTPWVVRSARFPQVLELQVADGSPERATRWRYTLDTHPVGTALEVEVTTWEPSALQRGLDHYVVGVERDLRAYLSALEAAVRAQSDAESFVQSP